MVHPERQENLRAEEEKASRKRYVKDAITVVFCSQGVIAGLSEFSFRKVAGK